MYHALDMGISVDDFWNMSARAVVNVQRQMLRERKAVRQERENKKKRGPRLARIPRP